MKIKLPQNAFVQNAEVYKVLANPKRLEILNLLRDTGALSVEAIADHMTISIANVSQHLRILRMHELVKTHRDGTFVYYSIIDPRIVEPCRILHALRSSQVEDN